MNNILVNDSEAVEALINQGNELEDLNRLNEALACYDRAVAINPHYARAHSNRGNVLQNLKCFDEAIASYDRSVTIRPDYPEAFFNRGNALQAQGRPNEALASYDHALEINPDFVIAIIGRGTVLHDIKCFDDALLNYKRALAIQPDYAEVHYNCGNVLIELKRFDEAIISYDCALALRPDYIEALNNRGSILYKMKGFDKTQWVNNYMALESACRHLLDSDILPAPHQLRIVKNMNYALQMQGKFLYSEYKSMPHIAALATNFDNKELIFTNLFPPINIVYVVINEHKGIFDDLLTAMESAIKELNIICYRSQNQLLDNAINVLIGSIVFALPKLVEATRNKSYIVYQLEPLSTVDGPLISHPEYVDLLRNASAVWDYSENNIKFLQSLGITQTAHVPAVYHKVLETLRQNQPKDIDILFIGSMSPRREYIINQLREAGVYVETPFGVYGDQRNALIERAKIHLNIHSGVLQTLEEVRLSFLLANHCFVISEVSDCNPYQDGVIFCPYDKLVETCLQYLRDDTHIREQIADRGYHAITRLPIISVLQRALACSL